MNSFQFRVDWCGYEAAKYACEHWHYSQCVPQSKKQYFGVWEKGDFIGAVIFGRSISPHLGSAFGLDQWGVIELRRVALANHITPVSRIVRICLSLLKGKNPKLRLVVSYADPEYGHNGAIYQAGNWFYIGKSAEMTQYYFRGKWRNDTSLFRLLASGKLKRDSLPKRRLPGKYKYLMPLDSEMRKRIELLRKPYPKKCGESIESDAQASSLTGRCDTTSPLQVSTGQPFSAVADERGVEIG